MRAAARIANARAAWASNNGLVAAILDLAYPEASHWLSYGYDRTHVAALHRTETSVVDYLILALASGKDTLFKFFSTGWLNLVQHLLQDHLKQMAMLL